MNALLQRLYAHEALSREEARQVLLRITREAYDPLQVAAFLSAYNMRPIALPELEGFRDALLELCVTPDLGGRESLDIVGTGGDGKNTFNISTTSAFVVAGAGYAVTKHGSYGVSSSVGSSNVLMALGYRFTDDPDALNRQLDRAGLCFLHAPLFHPALKAVVPIRKALGVKTFFNMLGPLVNPVQPTHQLYGTFSPELSRLYQYVMQPSGRQYAIVHALDGYDEISLTGPVRVHRPNGEEVLHPEALDLPAYSPDELDGGRSVEEAAGILLAVLEDRATPAQKDVVLANAGLAIQVRKPGQGLADCLAEARESIESGKALGVLKKVVNETDG
jgi:anthranilate phosphoribosyltransferase